MKQQKIRLLAIALTTVALTGCATSNSFHNAQTTSESWFNTLKAQQSQQPTEPNIQWQSSKKLSNSVAWKNTATHQLHIANSTPFNRIETKVPFRVVIVGNHAKNKVVVTGNDKTANKINMKVANKTLQITYRGSRANSKANTIFINVNHLDQLLSVGGNDTFAKNIRSNNLSITKDNGGKLYVAGNIKLHQLTIGDNTDATLVGIQTDNLVFNDRDNNTVNLFGEIGLTKLNKNDSGTLNIYGIKSSALEINSTGGGTTNLMGQANITKLYNRNANLYAMWVDSNNLNVTTEGSGTVGLAGKAKNFSAKLSGNSVVLGKYLNADNASVLSRNDARINISPIDHFDSRTYGNSKVYYFGFPKKVNNSTHDESIALRFDK